MFLILFSVVKFYFLKVIELAIKKLPSMSKLKIVIDELRDNDPSITFEVISHLVGGLKQKHRDIWITQCLDNIKSTKDVRKI